MSDSEKNKAQEAGDEVLKRMLKTPPKPHEKEKPTERKPKAAAVPPASVESD